jgi:hypothetical protein
MHQIFFIGHQEDVAELEVDENPASSFVCMSSQQFHRDARAQLYALVCGGFLADALEMELLDRELADEGPYLYRLEETLMGKLADLEEDQVEDFANLWTECEEIEALDLDANDLLDFIFLLVHFCQTACNDDLGVYIYSDS